MRLPAIGVAPAIFLLSCLSWLSAQQIQSTAAVTTVPRLVRISDTFHPTNAVPAARVESLTVSVYKDREGGAPLWQETQNVTLDSENRYSVLIGSTLNEGMPLDLLNSSEPRWLGVRFNRPDETEQPRVQMVSVPYALKASDAETLGGLPAAAYLRAPTSAPGPTGTAAASASATTTDSAKLKQRAASGTTNCIAAFTSSTNLGCSPMWQSGTSIGIGTTAPGSTLDIQNSAAGFANFLNMKSNFTGGGVGAAGVTLSHQFATMLMRAYSPGAPGFLQNSIGWFALNGSNKLLIGHAGSSVGNDLGFFTNNSWSNPQVVLTHDGNVGIGTTTPAFKLDVAGQINAIASPVGAVVAGFNSATSGFAVGVAGATASNGGAGVFGSASQPGAAGVTGSSSATSGFAVGVAGSAASNSGAGVLGNASQPGAAGVAGSNSATSGFAPGIQGSTNSPNGPAIAGNNNATTGGGGAGVGGATNQAGNFGVAGYNNATSGFAVGVQGNTASNNGAGVQGNANHAGAAGVSGFNGATSGYAVGVQGGTSSTNGAGVSGNSNVAGVFGTVGFNSATSGYAIGTEGASSSPGGVGVWGVSMACGNTGCTLVPGTAGQFQTATTGIILQGISGTAGANAGTATQVFLVDGHGNGTYAGNLQVNGNLNVGGTVSKSGGSFRIDHPLDPENKYLYHSFVESPDMMNIYNGVATLDEKGEAVVTLPDWFEALNRDFRYQLTCIGGYAPVYIARKVSGNQFRIAGGRSGLEISWQVTGIRHDVYANSHRIPVEVDKQASDQGPVTDSAPGGQAATR